MSQGITCKVVEHSYVKMTDGRQGREHSYFGHGMTYFEVYKYIINCKDKKTTTIILLVSNSIMHEGTSTLGQCVNARDEVLRNNHLNAIDLSF